MPHYGITQNHVAVLKVLSSGLTPNLNIKGILLALARVIYYSKEILEERK